MTSNQTNKDINLEDFLQEQRIIESLLFVLAEPLSEKRILQLLPDLKSKHVKAIIQKLNEEYDAQHRAFRILEIAEGYQFMTDEELAPWIKKALCPPKPSSVSKAALETLAIVAYRQPSTKADIEAIRGVDVGGALETLCDRGFVKVVGRKDTPGKPFLYATTSEFLRHFGLKSIEALPKPDLEVIEEPEAETHGDTTPVEEQSPTEAQTVSG